MLETRKRGSQRFATKTPYSVTEWRSSKDLNLGPTMLNVNRRRGGTGKQEAATLQLTGELLELVLTQIQFANIDENPETQTRKRGETNRSKGEARNIVEQGCEGDSKWSVGRKFLGLIALALDLDEGFFENIGALNDPTAVVRLLRYPGGLLKDDVLGSMNAKRTNNLPRELRAYRFPPILAGDYIGSPFRSRGKRWVCPLNLCFQNSHILETSQLLTNKGLPCLLMLETRKRGSQRFATKTPYSVTEWRSSKDLNLGPTMLNVNRRRGGTGKQEAATLQLTGELTRITGWSLFF
ncbi:hypothetical protein F2Q68_00040264 [Brassica cretica]|uniref:Uncharacterized protein n=1 Tax=Brassica cretica TaxID=69181 RepID=A0A8S9MFA7_BRACR|nr:hypothetical protein F2Q68_00040264 [Brassica cretica]